MVASFLAPTEAMISFPCSLVVWSDVSTAASLRCCVVFSLLHVIWNSLTESSRLNYRSVLARRLAAVVILWRFALSAFVHSTLFSSSQSNLAVPFACILLTSLLLNQPHCVCNSKTLQGFWAVPSHHCLLLLSAAEVLNVKHSAFSAIKSCGIYLC